MSVFFCDKCGVDRKFDHTDYYDFDIYVCPICGSEGAFPADNYGEPGPAYDDHDQDDPCHDWETIWDDGERSCCVCTICGDEKIFEHGSETKP